MARRASQPFVSALERTLRLSQYVQRLINARPGAAADIERDAAHPFGREEMRSALAEGAVALEARLRRLRSRVLAALAHRDLNGLAPLDEVFATMTALAEECVRAALGEAHARAGGPSLTIAALGKLGGGELNVSSDIDLVFLHAGGEEEHFARMGREVIALLSEVTAEGQAFRVDMRLRPFGDSGPIATSMGALEQYFIGHARAWERYAWLKARVIAGPGEGLAERVTPFVYRRYLDFGLLEALRELHARIFEAATRRGKADDVKVGAGGIREIEFCVQLIQLVRGGQDPSLRTTSTRAALAAEEARGLIEPARARALAAAYEFLRRLEHRLQYYDDQQTQALPRTPEHRAAIAEAMEFPDYDGFASALAAHRAAVEEAFDALFESKPVHASRASVAAWLNDPQAAPDPSGLAEDLRDAGIAEADEAARRLIEFTKARRSRSLSATIRARLERLVPAIVAAAAQSGGGAATIDRLLAIVETIDRREAYYALLIEYPQVLQRAAALVAKSLWVARLLARHPILLDELTRTAASFAATDWKAERAALAAECAALAGDVERLLDHLRHFKQRHVLRLTIADLEGELPVMALSDELSALADVVLDVTLERAADDAAFAGLCIVGYGKLGGKELGYGSDLDIIFLHDGTQPAERLARVAQRVNAWLGSHTAAGVLYEVDLRLRPDGASGLLVSSLDAFREYQAARAWTWEHQALTRARYCAGDRAAGERFEAVRDAILALARDRAKLCADVVAMRAKMRAEHKRGREAPSRESESANDIKHVAGGIIDLEFCVQALVLAHGHEHAQLRENKGNHTLLKRAGDLGLIDAGLAGAAADAYLAMRRRAHQAALNDEESVKLAPGELAAERDAVVQLWKAVFPPGPESDAG
jgi:[glutamine synthetase] adenylyltransferase / [glutamine synthetase]-adenylyl-L-tyrosine phosphorylase